MISTIISIYIYTHGQMAHFLGGLAYTLYELHSTGRCPSNRDVRLSLQAPQGDPCWVEIWEGENAPSHQHFYGVYKPSPNARFMIKSITLYYTTNTSLLRIYYYCHDCCIYCISNFGFLALQVIATLQLFSPEPPSQVLVRVALVARFI